VLAAAPLAVSGALTGLLIVVFAVVGFAIVALVAAVILALLHAVLPGEDTGAQEAHRLETERAALSREEAREREGEEAAETAEPRS
jgi:hypothetical protein